MLCQGLIDLTQSHTVNAMSNHEELEKDTTNEKEDIK